MEALIPIIAILMVFGAPTYLLKRVLDLRERRLQLEGGAMKELDEVRTENKLLAARVEAMEEVIYSSDFELNQKLKQIALEEEASPALPASQGKKLSAGSAQTEQND